MVTETMANPLARDLDETLDRNRAMWQELRGARVFLTGGSGFVGCWLLESFLWAADRLALDASIVVLTRNVDAFANKAPHLTQHPAVALVTGDVRTANALPGAFTHVVHAAADGRAILTREDRLRMFDTIVAGTGRMLEMARDAGASRFLLTSSGAVYGPQPPSLLHVTEDYAGSPDPTNPAHAYGEAKRAAEALCALHADSHFIPTIARCFAFVGPYLPLGSAFAAGNFVRDVLRGEPVRIGGDGRPYRTYLYGADLAVWLWTILVRGGSARAYNVGGEHALTIRELAETVARLAERRVPVEIHAAPAAGPAPRYVPSTARAREELGLTETISLEKGIEQTFAWHRGRSFA
jgi:nucleoside-diphosphate-sugar epimerase